MEAKPNYPLDTVPWFALLEDPKSKLKLQPWVRVDNDFKNTRYKGKILPISVLEKLADLLEKQQVKLVRQETDVAQE